MIKEKRDRMAAETSSARNAVRNTWPMIKVEDPRVGRIEFVLIMWALAFSFFAGANAIAIVLAVSGIDLDRYLPAPWPWTSMWSILCLALAMIWAMFVAIQLSIFRIRDIEHKNIVRRLDDLTKNVDKTLTELQADSSH